MRGHFVRIWFGGFEESLNIVCKVKNKNVLQCKKRKGGKQEKSVAVCARARCPCLCSGTWHWTNISELSLNAAWRRLWWLMTLSGNRSGSGQETRGDPGICTLKQFTVVELLKIEGNSGKLLLNSLSMYPTISPSLYCSPGYLFELKCDGSFSVG